MSLQEVKAKITTGDRAGDVYVVKIDLPETISEATEKYGEEVVFSRFSASLTIDLQSAMRSAIAKDGATAETVQTVADEWNPSVKARGKTMDEKIRDLLGKLSDEERRDLLGEYV